MPVGPASRRDGGPKSALDRCRIPGGSRFGRVRQFPAQAVSTAPVKRKFSVDACPLVAITPYRHQGTAIGQPIDAWYHSKRAVMTGAWWPLMKESSVNLPRRGPSVSGIRVR